MSTSLVRLMTASRARDARACRRKHYMKYSLGFRAVQDAHALRFGTLVHHGLEAWWLAVAMGQSGEVVPQEAWLDSAIQATLEREADAYELGRAQVMLTGYHLRWKDEQFEVLGVEQKFEGALVNPLTGRASRAWRLAGKLDVLVRDPAGRILVIEHKTSSEDVSQGSDYWKKLKLDGQVSIYFEGGRLLGHDVAACLYDVLGKPLHRPGNVPVTDEHGNKVVLDKDGQRVRAQTGKWRQTGDAQQGYVLQTRPETPEEFRLRLMEAVAEEPSRYFARGEVVRLEQEMADALADVWQLGKQLLDEESAQRYPRNPDACVARGRTCEYFGVCCGEASLEDERHYRHSEQLHPELADQQPSPQ